jgi:hypothetical protein
VDLRAQPVGGEPPYTFAWAFGDGSYPTTGPEVNHTYPTAGTFTVRLTTADQGGRSAIQTLTVPLGAYTTACAERSTNGTARTRGNPGGGFADRLVGIALLAGQGIAVALRFARSRRRAAPRLNAPADPASELPLKQRGWNFFLPKR